MIWVIGIIIVVAVGFIAAAFVFSPRASTGDVQLRLDEYANRETPLTLEEIELSQPFSERVLQPLFKRLAGFVTRFTPAKSIEKSRRDIEMAGRPVRSPEMFFGMKAAFGGVLGLISALLYMVGKGLDFTNFLALIQSSFTVVLVFIIGGTIGYLLPGIWLGSKIKKRQDEVVKSMPDALDLLVISVEAGLGFQDALGKVAEKWDNELSRAFARTLQEVQLGKTMNSALRQMEQNMGVADMTSFVAAIIQATSFGVSIAKVLRIQSEQMRIKRRQRAEKKAQEAPIKMLFPMVFLIFPSLFIVLLGPAALLIMESFRGGTPF